MNNLGSTRSYYDGLRRCRRWDPLLSSLGFDSCGGECRIALSAASDITKVAAGITKQADWRAIGSGAAHSDGASPGTAMSRGPPSRRQRVKSRLSHAVIASDSDRFGRARTPRPLPRRSVSRGSHRSGRVSICSVAATSAGRLPAERLPVSMNVFFAFAGLVVAAALGYWVGRRRELTRYQPLAARAASLEVFAAGVQASTEQERATIAREMHDQLGGIFVASKMDIDVVSRRLVADDATVKAKLAQVSASLDAGLALKRRLVERLHPSILDHLGLYAALQWRSAEMCTAAGRECTASVPDGDPGFSTDASIVVYRIAEQAISRALALDETSLVELDARTADDELHLAITDDGGSPGDAAPQALSSAWLSTLAHRTESLGGRCSAERCPDGGTRINIRIPLSRVTAVGQL